MPSARAVSISFQPSRSGIIRSRTQTSGRSKRSRASPASPFTHPQRVEAGPREVRGQAFGDQLVVLDDQNPGHRARAGRRPPRGSGPGGTARRDDRDRGARGRSEKLPGLCRRRERRADAGRVPAPLRPRVRARPRPHARRAAAFTPATERATSWRRNPRRSQRSRLGLASADRGKGDPRKGSAAKRRQLKRFSSLELKGLARHGLIGRTSPAPAFPHVWKSP